jgi:hypothetical protein
MNNNPYMNPYINTYNQQPMNNMQQVNNYDEYLKYLEKEKERIEKSKEQYINRFQQQQPTLNQTIQVTPTPSQSIALKHVKGVEDVNSELVMFETPFVLDDYSTLFIKNTKGEVRTFVMEEIIPKDEKDKIIEQLRLENEELKGMISNESTNATDDKQSNATIDKPTKTKTTSNVSVSTTGKSRTK